MAVIFEKETGRYYGVAREARRLGVTQVHLSGVLSGKRESKKLMKRIQIKKV
jgi:hypothetical protein